MPEELVERVIAGELPASAAAIRRERSEVRTDDQAYAAAGTFIDYLMRFKGTWDDYAAGVAAHAIRRWDDPKDRAWFAGCMRIVAELIEDNLEMDVGLFEWPGRFGSGEGDVEDDQEDRHQAPRTQYWRPGHRCSRRGRTSPCRRCTGSSSRLTRGR